MTSATSHPKECQVAVATVVGAAEVDHAIAKLVLAFGTDPVARWMYDDPHQYLLHIPRLFRALGTSSFAAGAAQRTSDGFGVALWLPPGVRGDDGPLEVVIAESIAGEKQAEVGTVFERTEHYRPIEPHWYLSLIGVEALHWNKGCGSTLLQHGLRQCDREHRPAYLWSSNPLNTSLYQRQASRSWIRSKSVRHLPSFRCCARRAENRISAAPMSAVKPALEEAGGKYLARGGMHKVYEGDWEPRRIVLLEFSTFKAWEAFYKGPTYQGLKAIREACSSARLVGIEGLT